MNSKVTRIEFDKTWSSSYGDFDQYNVSFENGDTGQVSVKKGNDAPWTVGDEAEYTKQSKDGYPDKIKKVFQQQGGKGGGGKWQPPTWETEKLKIPTMATAFAKDVLVASIAAGQATNPDTFTRDIDDLAKEIAKTIGSIAKMGGLS